MTRVSILAGCLAAGLWGFAAQAADESSAVPPSATATSIAPTNAEAVCPPVAANVDSHSRTVQMAVTAATPEAPVAGPGEVLAAAGITVDVVLTEQVSSGRRHRGDCFGIALGSALVIDGHEVAPAGTTGIGQVVDSHAAGLGGQPGSLVLAARYITIGGARLPLRGFRIASVGRDNTNVSAAMGIAGAVVPVVGIVAILVPGGDMVIPAGARAEAHVREATVLPAGRSAAPTTLPSQNAPAAAAPATPGNSTPQE